MMRTLSLLVCGLLLAALVVPALAKDGQRTPKDSIKAGYDTMAKVVTLTADQQPKFDAAVTALETALQDFDTKNNMSQLRADRSAAQKAGDKDKVKDLTAQIKPLEDQRKALEAPLKQAIIDVLTPEQKHTWSVYEVQTGIDNRLKKLILTDDQKTKIKGLVETAVSDRDKIAATDERGRRAVMTKLYDDIEQTVLTDDQRTQLKGAGKQR